MVYRLVSYVLGAAVAVNAALNDSSTLSFTNATSGNVTLFQPLFPAHSNSTPRFQNVSGVTANPLIQVLNNLQPSNHTLGKRQSASNGLPTGTCAPGTPCSNGACCSNVRVQSAAVGKDHADIQYLDRHMRLRACAVWFWYMHQQLRCQSRMRPVRRGWCARLPAQCLLLLLRLL